MKHKNFLSTKRSLQIVGSLLVVGMTASTTLAQVIFQPVQNIGAIQEFDPATIAPPALVVTPPPAQTVVPGQQVLVPVVAVPAGPTSYKVPPVCKNTMIDASAQNFVVKAPDAFYNQILARCSTFVTDLYQIQQQAQLAAQYKGLVTASNILTQALIQKAASLPPVDYDTIYPTTVESIRQGAQLALVLTNAAAQNLHSAGLNGKVRFSILNKIYNIIINAYNNLDDQYYYQAVTVCRGGGCESEVYTETMNREHFDGVRDLAVEFINLQNMTAQAQADDMVELNMATITAEAAKNVLMTSPYRRAYACAITNLYEIEVYARTNVCSGSQGIPSYAIVQSVESQLNAVSIPQLGCGGFGGGHNHHHGGW